MLLEAKASTSFADVAGRAPLHIASAMGHVSAVTALLEAGAKPSALDQHGNTAVHSAAVEAREAALGLLLAADDGAECLRLRNDDDVLPLHLATGLGDLGCCALMLAFDASLASLRVRDEGTPAHTAAEKGHSEVLGSLVPCTDLALTFH